MRKRKESPKGGDGGRGRKKRGGSYRSYRFIFEPDGGRGCSLKCSGELRGKREHFERLYGKKGIEHEKDDDEESDGRIVEGASGLLQDERFLRTVFHFFKWRSCPQKLTHEHLVKTEYNREIEQQHEKVEVKFLRWLVNRARAGRVTVFSAYPNIEDAGPNQVSHWVVPRVQGVSLRLSSQHRYMLFKNSFAPEGGYNLRDGYSESTFNARMAPHVRNSPTRPSSHRTRTLRHSFFH
jgi:hypothetical protein